MCALLPTAVYDAAEILYHYLEIFYQSPEIVAERQPKATETGERDAV
jgi:hypothetical protein